jgi:hypothetical protein
MAKSTTTDRKGRTIAVEHLSKVSDGQTSAASQRNKSRFESEKKAGLVARGPARPGRTKDRSQSTPKPGRTEKPKKYGESSAAPRFKQAAPSRKPARGGARKKPRHIINANPG